jgi:lipopolysaccharide/colanic/teichoic acid biosynthesis glycosyltransferase
MISPAQTSTAAPADHPTVWGLDPTQLHDRFWAARGVQVVRQGERSQIVRHAELFLLTDPRLLTIFRIGRLVEQLSWLAPELMVIRLHEARDHGYREVVITDDADRFVRFQRIYGASDSRLARVALTPSRRVAEMWQSAPDPRTGWRQLRKRVARTRRTNESVEGNVYERTNPAEVMQCVRDLIQVWKTPDATIGRINRIGPSVWGDVDSAIDSSVRFIGPAWVGAGRKSLPTTSVVGPAVLWDDPAHRPQVGDVQWQELEPSFSYERPVKTAQQSSLSRGAKRLFDIAFALLIILLTLPIYPLIMLAIWLEDGRPFFFTHKRETLGGKEFPCLKFRSMRRDADKIKAQLQALNRSDGPQFFIDPEKDPRLLKIGALLRKTNLDEIPQFFNVLVGHMSVVGPRPSPRSENQFSPAWREARLSVRPGITGLWQVMRTRQEGLDFQEWIKYDIQYVEKAGWKLDLWIIWKTILVTLKLSD